MQILRATYRKTVGLVRLRNLENFKPFTTSRGGALAPERDARARRLKPNHSDL